MLTKFSHLLAKLGTFLLIFGPFGVFAGALIDSLGIPIPAGIDLWLLDIAVKEPQKAYFAAFMAVLGSAGGNVALFLAAHHGTRRLIKGEPSARVQRFHVWFHKYGLLTVFIPAVTPIIPFPLKVFVVSAGALRTSFVKFLLVVLLARVLRYFGEAYVGLLLGEHASEFLHRNAWYLLGIAVAIALAFYCALRWRDRRGQPIL